jgi:hypothetical protein
VGQSATKTVSHIVECELRLHIVLENPPPGVVFGLQLGKGADYETIQKQTAKGGDLRFDCPVRVNDKRSDGLPNFLGPLTQGPPTDRFVYIDIGKLAGQTDSQWERRIKVPLRGVTWDLIRQAAANPKVILEARLAGRGKDGSPSCATVRPSHGWRLIPRKR